MIFNDNLYLLILRKLRVKFTKHFLGIETARNKENELRRLGWNLALELLFVFCKSIWLDGDTAFEFISDKYDLLYITRKPLLPDISPLLLLR